jgi:uncharacterized protein YkwD
VIRRLYSILAVIALLGCFFGQEVVQARQPAPDRERDAQSLLAPIGFCDGEGAAEAPAAEQEAMMRCLTDFARQRAGLNPFLDSENLDRSATAKSADILRCDSFSHYACGREFTYWVRASGSRCSSVGENLAWAAPPRASVRSIFRAWLQSAEHLQNILSNFDRLGIGMRIGHFEGRARAHVWTEHFGSHCGFSRADR